MRPIFWESVNIMNDFINAVIKIALTIREVVGGIVAPNLLIFQLISLVVSGALLWLCIYCISRSGWLNKRIENWMDYLGRGDVGKRRRLRAWNQIIRRMRTDEMANWKAAVLEADRLMDDLLTGAGYRYPNADERFKEIKPEELSNAAQIQEAHRLRNRVAQEPDFAVTKEQTLEILRVYKKAFQEFGLLD